MHSFERGATVAQINIFNKTFMERGMLYNQIALGLSASLTTKVAQKHKTWQQFPTASAGFTALNKSFVSPRCGAWHFQSTQLVQACVMDHPNRLIAPRPAQLQKYIGVRAARQFDRSLFNTLIFYKSSELKEIKKMWRVQAPPNRLRAFHQIPYFCPVTDARYLALWLVASYSWMVEDILLTWLSGQW